MPRWNNPQPSSTHEPLDGAVLWSLLLLVWLATLPLGSLRTWVLALLVASVFGLSLFTAWLWRHHGALALARLAPVRWPLGLLLALAAWMALQATPLPGQLVQTLSPEAWAMQQGVSPTFTLSLDPLPTRTQASLALALALVFALATLVLRERRRLDTFVLGLVLIGVFQAVLALFLWSVQARYQFLYFDVLHDVAKGTFGNRNHLAGFLMLLLSMGIGLMVARLGSGREARPRHWRGRLASGLSFVLSSKMRLRLMLVVLVIALVLTRSRMGNTAFFVALLVTGLLTLLLSRRSAPAMVWLVASLVVIDVVIVGTWVGLEKVLERIQDTDMVMAPPDAPPPTAALTTALSAGAPAGVVGLGDQAQARPGASTSVPGAVATVKTLPIVRRGNKQESVEERQLAASYTLDLVRDFPLAGTGAGSYYGSFIRYRSPGDAFFDHAHNDYAEMAANLGIVGFGLMGWLVVLSAATNLRTLWKRKSSMARGMAFGAFMATLGMAIHASVDFNLQIPANALLMVVILAVGWAAASLPSGRPPDAGT